MAAVTEDLLDVVVADDQPVFLEGMARALPAYAPVRVMATCVDGRAALDAILTHAPAVAIVDAYMEGLTAHQVLGAIRERGLPTRVVVISNIVTPSRVLRALSDGAAGYLSKRSTWEEFAEAIETAAGGSVWLCPRSQRMVNEAAQGLLKPLSPRESEVLELAADGLSDDEIGRRMHISSETVRTNLKRSGDKLGVRRRAALVAKALRDGWVD